MDNTASAEPLARVHLPITTRRYTAILNLEARLNRAEPGAVRYERDWSNVPDGATGTSWDVYTPAALAAYKRLGAIVVTAQAAPTGAPAFNAFGTFSGRVHHSTDSKK